MNGMEGEEEGMGVVLRVEKEEKLVEGKKSGLCVEDFFFQAEDGIRDISV